MDERGETKAEGESQESVIAREFGLDIDELRSAVTHLRRRCVGFDVGILLAAQELRVCKAEEKIARLKKTVDDLDARLCQHWM